MVQRYRSVLITLACLAASLFALTARGQGSELFRQRIVTRADTIYLDSLPVVPGSVTLTLLDGQPVFHRCFHLAPDHRRIVLHSEEDCLLDSIYSLIVSYRCFPFALDKPFYSKKQPVRSDSKSVQNPFVYVPSKSLPNDIFQMGSLNKEGSLTRGLTFGNNQDVVVNSTMNLQLSGKLTDDLDLLLSATDDNIPVQPDGTTAQLQEFDKIFIQVGNKRQKLTAGDLLLSRPPSYFLNYQKKAQGLHYETNWRIFDRRISGSEKNILMGSGAVSKGKFARNTFNGTEGNQGPYRLRGNENELFIVILSGTEAVYIDGELLQRGSDRDYVIDYNTAELTFTPTHVITKDKRIVVEFQYSDKLYARSVYTAGYEYQYKDGSYSERHYVYGYSEQDVKNRPLQQTLTNEDKELIAAVGDSLHMAYTYAIDSLAYSNSEVRYRKTDSLVGTYTFSDIYVYSTDEDSAHYRLSFSFVGAGKGNYNAINSTANGKVYQWVVPDTLANTPRGSYEPVLLLVSPKKKQMITAGTEIILGTHKKLIAEGAFSVNDINLFSGSDKKNDQGFGGKLQFEFPLFLLRTKAMGEGFVSGIKFGAGYEFVHRNFSPVERFRSVEFERDWNRVGLLQTEDLHLISGTLAVFRNKELPFSYTFRLLSEGNTYQGMQHEVGISHRDKKNQLQLRGSRLQSGTGSMDGVFNRLQADLSRRFGMVRAGGKFGAEENRFRDTAGSLQAGSFNFLEWEVFVASADTGKISWKTSYKHRTDGSKGTDEIVPITAADNYSLLFRFSQPSRQSLAITATYRQLRILDSILSLNKPDESIIGRFEYEVNLWKGVLASQTFFEAGAGLEQKKEFAFLEVPAGQGIYTWVDHNGNGIKELNEFEVAPFPDQATYIKVYIPTQDYIRTYYNQFSQSLWFRPGVKWKREKGWKKGISRFSNQVNFRGDRKSTEEDLLVAYNPFLQDVDELTLQSLNSSFRNTLWINQGAPDWAMDISWNDQRGKSLLANGFDSRGNQWYEGNARLNAGRKWGLFLQYKDGYRSFRSQFFPTRDYHYHYYEVSPKIHYQPEPTFRAAVSFKYSEKLNAADLGGHRAEIQNSGVELRYTTLQKGALTAKANFIRILYAGAANGSIHFEFLEGLSSGNNYTWGLTFQRTLSSNIQVQLTYDGRLPEGSRVVHTGGAQVRASF